MSALGMSNRRQPWFFVTGACLLLSIAACGEGTAPEPASDPLIVDEADFGTSDLFVLDTTGDRAVHRFVPDQSKVEQLATDHNPDERTVFRLAAGYAHVGLYASTATADGRLGDVRRIDGGTEIVHADPPVVACLDTGHSTQRPVGAIEFDEPTAGTDGLGGTWIEIGSDTAFERRRFEPHVFCAVRGNQPARWAVALQVTTAESWTTELEITTDEGKKKLAWPDCVLVPQDFSGDGMRLIIAATCHDAARSGLHIIEVPSLASTDEPLFHGAVAAARWSPSERLIAFAHRSIDNDGSQTGPPFRVKVLRLSDGATQTVPVDNASWPAWVMREPPAASSPSP